MREYTCAEAKQLIHSICRLAREGEFDTREKFFAVLGNHPEIAVQGYNAFGKIFYWNAASTRLYGHSESAAFNKDLFELILPPEMRMLARRVILTAVETGRTPEASACDLLHCDGGYVTVFSGHLLFRWPDVVSPEFYCLDIKIESLPA